MALKPQQQTRDHVSADEGKKSEATSPNDRGPAAICPETIKLVELAIRMSGITNHQRN